ncbi:glycosyltransferase [Romboutsia sedimentorum]|uniref:glycosyltransferase n=1 Tax=Romboutsia sedimentorum TaxID=1368474 RepID=UPI0024DE2A00|nr:glycosyltransferase [Romboutsia sedimentorum]MDK2585829.1 glycosyltransferase [Romboutsia sedimentorum]
MNVVQINNTDLIGRRFNGYDLKTTLNALGHQAHQIVLEKESTDDNTISLLDDYERAFIKDTLLRGIEYELDIHNLLIPWGRAIMENEHFKNADIVHYHLIHNRMISLLDIEKLFNAKSSVWTIHDPWVISGHCIYPHKCEQWKVGCTNCEISNDASQIWKIKEQVYKKINPHIIVASEFSERYIKESPLTSHFNNIYKIPFGIEIDKFTSVDNVSARKYLNVPQDHLVLAFRETLDENKGLKYIIKMLENLDIYENVTLLTVGGKALPNHIKEKYNTIQLEWKSDSKTIINFFNACDIFIMPSLVESFGLMAIEAMASGKPVIVFKETVLEEITYAPNCGIAVHYKDWKALKEVVNRLLLNPDERYARGEKGKSLAKEYYSYDRYVNQHIELYKSIIGMNKI